MKLAGIAMLASALLLSPAAQASGEVHARISKILSYNGHTGLLITMSSPHQNFDGCYSSAYYIFPDNASRASIVQAMLVSAQMSGKTVEVVVDGCYENFPKIVHVTVVS
jgi:hypothetical protein